MATHSSVLAWRIPGMGEPGGLPSMGSHRVGHDWSDSSSSSSLSRSCVCSAGQNKDSVTSHWDVLPNSSEKFIKKKKKSQCLLGLTTYQTLCWELHVLWSHSIFLTQGGNTGLERLSNLQSRIAEVFLTNYRARVSSLRCDVRGLVFRQRLLLLETAEGEQSPGSQLPLPLEWRENTTLTSLWRRASEKLGVWD